MAKGGHHLWVVARAAALAQEQDLGGADPFEDAVERGKAHEVRGSVEDERESVQGEDGRAGDEAGEAHWEVADEVVAVCGCGPCKDVTYEQSFLR